MMIKLAGVVIVATICYIIIKRDRAEYAFILEVSVAVVLMISCFPYIENLFEYMKDMFDEVTVASDYVNILLKCVGYALIAKLLHALCLDAGENAMSVKVDLVAKILILVTAMPVFNEIFNLLKGLLENYL